MAMHYMRRVMSPEELKDKYALPNEHKELKVKRDEQISDAY